MKAIKILQRDDPVLRKTALPVAIKDIKSKRIKDIIQKMKLAMNTQEDGVAIAAPQIGESLRIFVVSGKALAWTKKVRKPEEVEKFEDLIFINPEITKSSKKKKSLEEGCLSVRYLYGKVERSDKVTLKAYTDMGKLVERGASGLLAQIFQHELDHLNGILFIDKAEDLKEMPPTPKARIVFFGSSQFSQYVLEELNNLGISLILEIKSAKDKIDLKKLKELQADLFVVASFGKILPKEVLDLPRFGSLNVHPSLLPKMRGPSPIQNTILAGEETGITVIKMDEEMDHGPILAQAKFEITPWPDHYSVVEEKLGRVGGRILGTLIPEWISGTVKERDQDCDLASYTRLIKKEDGLLDLEDDPEVNLRKTLAYSTWPGAYLIYKNKRGKEVRVVVKDAVVRDGKFSPIRVIPAGKREMSWTDFLRGN